MNRSENINEIATALSKAQASIKGATKDQVNPFFSKDGRIAKYADLNSVWEACRGPLAENGLAVLQFPRCKNLESTGAEEARLPMVVTVETLLTHSSGQWFSDELSGIPVKEVKDGNNVKREVESRTPQAIGSCITYLRRYALAAFVGVAPEDDDGNEASGVDEEHPPAQADNKPKKLNCPKCGREGTVIKGKAEFGGGYLCWKKEGGCGAKFADNDAEIIAQIDGKPAPAAAPQTKPPRANRATEKAPEKQGASPQPTPGPSEPPKEQQPEPSAPNPQPEEKPMPATIKGMRDEVYEITKVTPSQLAIHLANSLGGEFSDSKQASEYVNKLYGTKDNPAPDRPKVDAVIEETLKFSRKHSGKARWVILGESKDEELVAELREAIARRLA